MFLYVSLSDETAIPTFGRNQLSMKRDKVFFTGCCYKLNSLRNSDA